jgi:hypothetical protein
MLQQPGRYIHDAPHCEIDIIHTPSQASAKYTSAAPRSGFAAQNGSATAPILLSLSQQMNRGPPAFTDASFQSPPGAPAPTRSFGVGHASSSPPQQKWSLLNRSPVNPSCGFGSPEHIDEVGVYSVPEQYQWLKKSQPILPNHWRDPEITKAAGIPVGVKSAIEYLNGGDLPLWPQAVWALRSLTPPQRRQFRNELAFLGREMLAAASNRKRFESRWSQILILSAKLVANEKAMFYKFFFDETLDEKMKEKRKPKLVAVQKMQEKETDLIAYVAAEELRAKKNQASTQVASIPSAALGPVGLMKRGAELVDTIAPAPSAKKARVQVVNLTGPGPTPVQQVPVQSTPPQPASVAPQRLTPEQQAAKAARELKGQLIEVIYTEWKADIDYAWGRSGANLPSAKSWVRVPSWLSTRVQKARMTARGMQHILERAAPILVVHRPIKSLPTSMSA